MQITVPLDRFNLLEGLLPESIYSAFQAIPERDEHWHMLSGCDDFSWAVLFGATELTIIAAAPGLELSHEGVAAFEAAREAYLHSGVTLQPLLYDKCVEAKRHIDENLQQGRHWSVGIR